MGRRSCLGSYQNFAALGAAGLLIGGLLVFATLSANDQISTHQDDSVAPSSSATANELQEQRIKWPKTIHWKASTTTSDQSSKAEAKELKAELASLRQIESAIKGQPRRKRAAQGLKTTHAKATPREGNRNKKSLVESIVYSKTLKTPSNSEARLALAEAILDGPGQKVLLDDESPVEPLQDDNKGLQRKHEETGLEEISAANAPRKPRSSLDQAAAAVAAHLARAEHTLQGNTKEIDLLASEAPTLESKDSLKQAVEAHLARAERTLQGNAKEMDLLASIPPITQTRDSLKQAVATRLAHADTTISHVEENEEAIALKRQLAASQAFSQEFIPQEEAEEAAVPLW
jgi:hypothetical protein